MLRSRSEPLSAGEIQQIHDTSMALLANVGVLMHAPEAVALLRAYGARCDGERVFLTEDQVLGAVSQAPPRFTIHARNAVRSAMIGDREPVFVPAYGAPFVVDLEHGKRTATMADYHQLARLVHALPNQDLSGHYLVQPSDVDPHTAYLAMLQAHMIHSDKAFMGSVEGQAGAQHTMEMAEILFEREIVDWPVTLGLINSLSPLGYSHAMLDALLEYARWRQPVVIAALAMAGMTAPVTLGGLLAMQNAELLAGIALAQIASPGTPVVYGSASSSTDMRTGALVIGSPELSLLVAAHTQMARHYGLPCRSGGSLTDACAPDAQAGYESMMSLLTAANSSVDLVVHAAGITGSFLAISFEKLVLDDEMCGMVRRFRRGIEVTPDTLAYDVTAWVGPEGNYLMEDHTLHRCRTEFWQPAVNFREGVEAWMEQGRPDAAHLARRRWQELVARHEDPPLDAGTARRLQEFCARHGGAS